MELANHDNTAVIIPCYNAENSLTELIRRIESVFDTNSIYIIDDASKDDTYNIASQHKLNFISFEQNQGKGAALSAGFKKATKDGYLYAITLDSDLQHEPEDIPHFLEEQNRKFADIVIGKRNFTLDKMPFPRIMSNRMTTCIVNLVSGGGIKDSQSGYRLYNLKMLQNLDLKTKRYQFETEIYMKMAQRGATIAHVPIKTIYNDEISYISHGRDIFNFVKLILREGFSQFL